MTFSHCGDRHQHSVDLVDGAQTVRGWTSREGDDDEPWPPSPPLQELHYHESSRIDGGRKSVLAVGMAGTSHWSLSAEPHDEGIVFDVAVRVRELPIVIGSSYQRSTSGGAFHTIEFVPLSGAALVLDGNGPASWTDNAREILIRPQLSEVDPLAANAPMTMRWRYLARESLRPPVDR